MDTLIPLNFNTEEYITSYLVKELQSAEKNKIVWNAQGQYNWASKWESYEKFLLKTFSNITRYVNNLYGIYPDSTKKWANVEAMIEELNKSPELVLNFMFKNKPRNLSSLQINKNDGIYNRPVRYQSVKI